LYGVAALTYTLEYGLNFPTYGAFLLDLVQTKPLLNAGLALTTKTGETLATLPLWLLYCAFVAGFGRGIARAMLRDIQAGRRRRP
jgi:hypothetical protein